MSPAAEVCAQLVTAALDNAGPGHERQEFETWADVIAGSRLSDDDKALVMDALRDRYEQRTQRLNEWLEDQK